MVVNGDEQRQERRSLADSLCSGSVAICCLAHAEPGDALTCVCAVFAVEIGLT